MTTDQTIVLYDFARRGDNPHACWSYNVWKTRMALNYKGVPYRAEWVDHNDINSVIAGLGVPVHATSPAFPYTVPTARFPDDNGGSVVTDSAAIVAKVEALHPTPSLRLSPDLEAEAGRLVHEVVVPLLPVYVPRAARVLIIPETLPAFTAPREKLFGVSSMDELEKTKGGESAWEATKPKFAELAAFMRQHKKDDGPFVQGSEVCYTDFIIVPLFHAVRQVGEDLFERVVDMDPSFRALYDACRVWVEKNN